MIGPARGGFSSAVPELRAVSRRIVTLPGDGIGPEIMTPHGRPAQDFPEEDH